MSTIHAFTSPARGHIYPLTPILRELRRRGHRVRVWTLASELEPLRALGLEAEPISPAIEALPIEDWQTSKPAEGARLFFDRVLERGTHEVADLNAALALERPDLIITDINCLGAQAAAQASGIPWATFSPYFSWYRDEGIPAFGPGMAPMRGPVGRLRDNLVWKAVSGGLDKNHLGPLNDLREAVGAPGLGSMQEIWTQPPLLLYMTVPELDYPRPNMPASWRMVGPCRWEPPAPTPRWLAEIDKPLVLVTASTEYQADERLIETALEALAGEDVSVVATTAGNDPAAFEVPANARVERFLPHAPLLERAEVVVCHGGMGITQKALAAGVPICTVGWGRDQLESGRRAEVAGAGILLPRKRLGVGPLRGAVRKARLRRDGAERIAAALAAAPGPAGAADELEQLLPVAV